MDRSAPELAVIVLAAGQGTRMKSRKAKVLHELCGLPMLGHVLAAAEALEPVRLYVVVGRDADSVQETFAGRAEFVMQADQRGTGHAVMQVEPKLRGFEGDVLVLYADTPALRSETLENMRALKRESGAELVMLTSPEPLPGLVVRGTDGRVERVVEQVDATREELARLREGNTGVYLFDSALLRDGLAQLDDANSQGELYLTDVVSYAVAAGRAVEAVQLDDPDECLGVNTRAELAEAAAVLRFRKLDALMEAGVSIVDPDHTYVDVQVEIGRDSSIEPGCVIQGDTRIGEGVHIKPHCTIESSRIDDDVVIGPCAHLRPGTHLMQGVRIGNFVEVKNSVLGPGVKADHLSYVGDADVGADSSFGCGSITVNYDWKAKHRTAIGERTKIGCNANLIAPLEVGSDVSVAAGSTLTSDVPDGALAVARAKQRNVDGWAERARLGKGSAAKPRKKKAAGKKAASATGKRKAKARRTAGAKAASKSSKPARKKSGSRKRAR